MDGVISMIGDGDLPLWLARFEEDEDAEGTSGGGPDGGKDCFGIIALPLLLPPTPRCKLELERSGFSRRSLILGVAEVVFIDETLDPLSRREDGRRLTFSMLSAKEPLPNDDETGTWTWRF